MWNETDALIFVVYYFLTLNAHFNSIHPIRMYGYGYHNHEAGDLLVVTNINASSTTTTIIFFFMQRD